MQRKTICLLLFSQREISSKLKETDYLFQGTRESLPQIKRPQKFPKLEIGDLVEFFYLSETGKNDSIPKLLYIMSIRKSNLFGINLNYLSVMKPVILEIIFRNFPVKQEVYKEILKITLTPEYKNEARRFFLDKQNFTTYALENIVNDGSFKKFSSKDEINNLIRNNPIKGNLK